MSLVSCLYASPFSLELTPASAEIRVNPAVSWRLGLLGANVALPGFFPEISLGAALAEFEQTWVRYPKERLASIDALSVLPLNLKWMFLKSEGWNLSLQGTWRWFSNDRDGGYTEAGEFWRMMTWVTFWKEATADFDFRLSWEKENLLYTVRPDALFSAGVRFRPGKYLSLYLSAEIAVRWLPGESLSETSGKKSDGL